jgi:Uma2 family endonuclease
MDGPRRERYHSIMQSVAQSRATLDDLYREDGKAELVGGRIVRFMPSGRLPGRIALRIAMSLDSHARKTGVGEAFGDGVGFAVPELPSGRESFSPDASYHVGPSNTDPMRFIEGAPVFAAEVRSENNYGSAAEVNRAAKRADYFLAGTLVVWDVDPIAQQVRVYRTSDPARCHTYGRGTWADAEPAVPGWRMAIDELFA